MNRLFLTAAVALAVGLFAQTAAAQSDADRERARSEFDRGVTLYTAENFQGALEAFQEAYRLRPHPTVRVNIANCYDRLNRPIEAIFHYERYLADSGRGAPSEQRREVDSALRRLRARVGELTLRISPDGAAVVVDDGDSRRAPILEPIRLTVGTHRLGTHLAGYRTDQRTVEIPSAGTIDVEIRLEREGTPGVAAATPRPAPVEPQPPVVATTSVAAAVVTPPPPQPTDTTSTSANPDVLPPAVAVAVQPPPAVDPGAQPDTSSGLVFTAPTVIAGSASGALLVTAIITGLMASSANSDFNDLRSLLLDPMLDPADDPAIRQSAIDKANQAQALALATDIIGAVGLVGVGITAYLFITDQGATSDRALASRGSRLGVTPTVSGDGAGVALHGSF